MLWSLSARVGEATAWHRHEVCEFIFCRGGQGRLEAEERSIEFLPGRTLFVAPGVRHRYDFDSGDAADLKLLCLHPQDMATFLSPAQNAALESLKSAGVSHADHGAAADRLWALAAMVPDGFDISDARELRLVWSVIGLLLAMHGKALAETDDPADSRYRQKIEDIRAWLDDRLDEAPSLEVVAARFGLSRSLLTREFRRHTGKSFIDYCNGRRIEKAARILVTTGEPVTRVALDSGFANLSHFHRQFKAIYGLTPAAFRRQIAGVGDA